MKPHFGAILALGLSLTAPIPARAEPVESIPEGGFRPPPARPPIAAERPLLPEREFPRRRFELGAAAGVAHSLCPDGVDRCSNQPGLALGLRALSRPGPHFGWGFGFDQARFSESLSGRGVDVSIETRARSFSLFGRVFPNASGALDPYLQLGFGGGSHAESGTVRLRETGPIVVDSVDWVPLLEFAAGLDVRVGSSFELGAQFGWTHWLLDRAERCNTVAFGVCTLPSQGHFDVANALWRWQLGATFLFGAPH